MVHFYLVPSNQEARQIASDPLNELFRTQAPRGEPILQIGDFHKPKCPENLVTFGRDPKTCDVHLGNSKYISKTHCYIYVRRLSGEFILRDVSGSRSTFLEVEGEEEKYRLQGDPRRRVLPRRKALKIFFLQAEFQIRWRSVEIHPVKTFLSPESSFVRSTVERISLPPPIYNTRVQRPKTALGEQILERIDHEPRGSLGTGCSGAVKLTVDLDSGRLLAVKQLRIDPLNEKAQKEKAKSEVQIISKLKHRHIAVFVHSQGWEVAQMLELFMVPYDGTLRAVKGFGSSLDSLIQRTLMTQMLSALEYLQQQRVVHSDVKPDNILQNGMGKDFYLADFGLASYLEKGRIGRGTPLYAPPEAFGDDPVDTTVDIWSLGVTLLEMENAVAMGYFLLEAAGDISGFHRGIISIAETKRTDLLPMLKENARERFDAKKCVQHYSLHDEILPRKPEIPSKNKETMPSSSKGQAKSGSPTSLKNTSSREQQRPAPAKRPRPPSKTTPRPSQQRGSLQQALQSGNQNGKEPSPPGVRTGPVKASEPEECYSAGPKK